ncbi:unnamed protein product [Rotaria sp. Silwood1]|nr:unnamed protein product [Rotaria sp. Silwood1]
MISNTIQLTQSQATIQHSGEHVTEHAHYSPMITNQLPISDINKPFDQWNAADICHWLKDRKVPEELITLYDFQTFAEMQNYATDLRIDPKNEFTKHAQRYARKYPGDALDNYVFQRLITALLSLPEGKSELFKREPLSTISVNMSTTKSSACILL